MRELTPCIRSKRWLLNRSYVTVFEMKKQYGHAQTMNPIKELSPNAYQLWLDVRMRSFPTSRENVIPFPEWPRSDPALELMALGFMEQNAEGKFQATELGYEFPFEFVKVRGV